MHQHAMGFCHVIALAAIFQIVASQDVRNLPPECRGPPPNVQRPHECCPLPPFFPREDFVECGFEQPSPRRGPSDCTKQICVLKKHGLMKDDSEIDYQALGQYIDQWGKENEAFEPVMSKVKESCLRSGLPGPPQACESNKLMYCVTSKIFNDCPIWQDNENCKVLRDHMTHCKPYFDEL